MDKPMPRYPEAIPLLTLQNRLKDLITAATRLQNQWVVAEFSDVMRKGGHIYADLVQKDECGCTVARLRATLWHGTGMGLFRQYGPRLSEIFMNGAEAKLCGSVSFHPLFGLNFNITDLDPSYRRDTSRLQAEIIAALRREGVIDANKSLDMPVAPQRIAVISAEGAAGYGDFKAHLHNNPYRLKFFPVLFPATMQGAAVSPTVREALEAVRRRLSEFDCVAIIRGGGSTTDLAGFDELQLARAVATFPLPVIVGIGHERDNTVLDFIAHTRVKTPTAAAEWLVANAAGVLARITELARATASYVSSRLAGDNRQLRYIEEHIPISVRSAMDRHRSRLAEITSALPLSISNRVMSASNRLEAASRAIDTAGARRIEREKGRLEAIYSALPRDTGTTIQRERARIERLEDAVEMLSPRSVLARGYSITRAGGHALRDPADAPPGTQITTTLAHGTLTSKVNKI